MAGCPQTQTTVPLTGGNASRSIFSPSIEPCSQSPVGYRVLHSGPAEVSSAVAPAT